MLQETALLLYREKLEVNHKGNKRREVTLG